MCHQRREIPRNDSSSSCNLSGRGSKTRMNQRLQLLLGGPISYSMWKRLTEHKHILMDVVPRPLGISVTEKNSSSHVKAFPYLTYWPGSWGRVSTCEGSHWSGPDHCNWVGLLAASLVDESWERPFRSNWGEREHGKACTPPVMTLTELQVKWTLQPRFSPYCLPILDENKNSNGAQNSHRIQAYLGPKVRCC